MPADEFASEFWLNDMIQQLFHLLGGDLHDASIICKVKQKKNGTGLGSAPSVPAPPARHHYRFLAAHNIRAAMHRAGLERAIAGPLP